MWFKRQKSILVPSLEWYDAAQKMTQYTPDLLALQELTAHNLFVYDDMMTGGGKHNLLAGCQRQCSAFTLNGFSLWKKKLGNETFPIALTNTFNKGRKINAFTQCQTARVKGELYSVSTKKLLELDTHKVNTLQFERQRIILKIPFTVEYEDQPYARTHGIRLWAHAYIGKSNYWDGLIDNGAQFNLVRKFNGKDEFTPPYYWFTNDECETGYVHTDKLTEEQLKTQVKDLNIGEKSIVWEEYDKFKEQQRKRIS